MSSCAFNPVHFADVASAVAYTTDGRRDPEALLKYVAGRFATGAYRIGPPEVAKGQHASLKNGVWIVGPEWATRDKPRIQPELAPLPPAQPVRLRILRSSGIDLKCYVRPAK